MIGKTPCLGPQFLLFITGYAMKIYTLTQDLPDLWMLIYALKLITEFMSAASFSYIGDTISQ